MRLLALLAVTLAVAGAAPAATAAAPPPGATVFGDSVQASFTFVPQAVRRLGAGLRLRLEARVCRRLSSPGCLGGSPEPVLGAARALGPSLGDLVVLNVGYNDVETRYDAGAVMRELRRSGVRVVIWVTLREGDARYAAINDRIRAAARRARGGDMVVRVADWNAYSAGRAWFASDGLHLNAAGALGLATLLRAEVLAGLAEAGVAFAGRPVRARARLVPVGPVTRLAGGDGALWLAGAGGLRARAARTGRALPGRAPLGPGEDLVSDGHGAWLREAAGGRLTRPVTGAPGLRGRVIDGLGPRPLLARAGAWLWAVAACAAAEPGCAGGQALRGVRLLDGARAAGPLGTGPVEAAAADRRALWLVVGGTADGRARLERRDPVTGRLRRTSRLPRGAAARGLVATGPEAWVLLGNGALLRAGRDGRLRRVQAQTTAIAGGGGRLWTLRRDGRTVLELDAASGRVRARARSPRPLAGAMTVTGGSAWLLAAGRRAVLRVPVS